MPFPDAVIVQLGVMVALALVLPLAHWFVHLAVSDPTTLFPSPRALTFTIASYRTAAFVLPMVSLSVLLNLHLSMSHPSTYPYAVALIVVALQMVLLYCVLGILRRVLRCEAEDLAYTYANLTKGTVRQRFEQAIAAKELESPHASYALFRSLVDRLLGHDVDLVDLHDDLPSRLRANRDVKRRRRAVALAVASLLLVLFALVSINVLLTSAEPIVAPTVIAGRMAMAATMVHVDLPMGEPEDPSEKQKHRSRQSAEGGVPLGIALILLSAGALGSVVVGIASVWSVGAVQRALRKGPGEVSTAPLKEDLRYVFGVPATSFWTSLKCDLVLIRWGLADAWRRRPFVAAVRAVGALALLAAAWMIGPLAGGAMSLWLVGAALYAVDRAIRVGAEAFLEDRGIRGREDRVPVLRHAMVLLSFFVRPIVVLLQMALTAILQIRIPRR